MTACMSSSAPGSSDDARQPPSLELRSCELLASPPPPLRLLFPTFNFSTDSTSPFGTTDYHRALTLTQQTGWPLLYPTKQSALPSPSPLSSQTFSAVTPQALSPSQLLQHPAHPPPQFDNQHPRPPSPLLRRPSQPSPPHETQQTPFCHGRTLPPAPGEHRSTPPAGRANSTTRRKRTAYSPSCPKPARAEVHPRSGRRNAPTKDYGSGARV